MLLALMGVSAGAAAGVAPVVVASGISSEEGAETGHQPSSVPADEAARGKDFWQDDELPPPTAEQVASQQAAASGKRVNVDSLTTGNSQVFANADGTFTAESSVAPERVLKGGTWAHVDTTLLKRSDGSIAPRVAEDITLSGGGDDAPLARMVLGAKEYAVSSPWTLPEPVVEGSAAVYRSVLPDVDLAVQVYADGFTYHLVVHSREAATNPKLSSVRFPVKTRGLTLHASEAGPATFVDAGGHAVLSNGSALMWDSASGVQAAPAAPSARGSVEPALQALSADDGSHTSVMKMEVTGDGLSITPDQSFLADSETVFPVVLDPPSTKATLTGWTTVWSNSTGTSFWKTSHALGVGYDAYVDFKKARSLYQFDTRSVSGKKILGATFTGFEIWSANCTKQNVDLYRMGSTISTSTTWSHQPKWSAKVDTVSAAKGYSSSCPDGDVEFDATAAVAYQAKAKATTTTLGLMADEEEPLAWKQFMSPLDDRATDSKKPRLSITYVTPPTSKPSSVKMSDPNVACSASTSPAVIRDATPRLTATPIASDGSNAVVRPNFELYTGTTTTPKTYSPTTWTASGTAGTVLMPTLAEGTAYRFRARTEYKYTYGGATSSISGPWSNACYFKVDTKGPPMPVVTSTEYPPCAGTSCAGSPETGSVGMTGHFHVTVAATDVRRYDWWLNGVKLGSKTFTANTAAYDLTVTPDKRLSNTLRVQAFDAAGNTGASKDYLFNVSKAADPVGVWNLDEGFGTTATDSAGSNAMTLSTASWAKQARNGSGLRSVGNNTYATSTGQVVDTTSSFAVSAWVKLAEKKQSTILQQRGTAIGAFQLYYSASYDRWIFNRYDRDATYETAAVVRAIGKQPPVINAWTHLLGVYDQQAKKIRLYVNGQLEAETAYTTPWAAKGTLEVGRWDGNNQLVGEVDQIQVWNRVVFPDELWAIVNLENPDTGHPRAALLANWNLDETSGTTGADSSGRDNSLTLKGGATFVTTDDAAHGNVLGLDAASDGYATSVAMLDDRGSFTVAGWVNLDAQGQLEDTANPHSPTVFSHPGAQRDAFRLWYRQETGESVGHWNFGTFDSDVLHEPYGQATSDEVNAPNGWVHVVGVFDSVNQAVKLYVTGERQGDEDGALAHGGFQPAGPLMIGKGRRHDTGALGNQLTGQLDDLRVYAGVLSDDEITQLATVDEPPVEIG
ncbi:LamG-like jellyroll fold domain-containing protein [Streptomyces sp. NBC_01358]|uniref:LamG-like jellyroll fold domain-containing protein n=1 Tax=Streptomyces sp. NBC_01358 TaxID=2903837 RepID=UPI002E362B3F|nr:LamG-like jellyroll fold domain-containing protein [Streptomyces sp. NBC_01358]